MRLVEILAVLIGYPVWVWLMYWVGLNIIKSEWVDKRP